MADFPVAPVQIEPFNHETQSFSSEWYAYYNGVSSQLRDNFGNIAYIFPDQPTSTLQQPQVASKTQSITYNSTTETMQVNNNGEFQEIATNVRKTTAELNALTVEQKTGRVFFNTDTNTLVTSLDGAGTFETIQTV